MDDVLLRKTTRSGRRVEIGEPDREELAGDWTWTLAVTLDGEAMGRGFLFPVAEIEGEPPLFAALRAAGFSHAIASEPVIGLTERDAAVIQGALTRWEAPDLRPLAWWRQKAGQGDPEAMFVLACHRDLEEAEKSDWMRRSAEAGHAVAQTNMALATDDPEERHRWLILAARGGDPAAFQMLEIDSIEELEELERELERGTA